MTRKTQDQMDGRSKGVNGGLKKGEQGYLELYIFICNYISLETSSARLRWYILEAYQKSSLGTNNVTTFEQMDFFECGFLLNLSSARMGVWNLYRYRAPPPISQHLLKITETLLYPTDAF